MVEPEDELVSLSEVARRVGLGSARVHELHQDDLDFPPYQQVGRVIVISWASARRYFTERDYRPIR